MAAMTDFPNQDNLGPLPQSDRQAELQRLSFKKLAGLLANQDELLLREEPTEDRGVDGSFEVKLPQGYTNMRSQVQLRSKDSVDRNADGSISLSVQASNFNHLLNGTCPIYILYDALGDQFWYTWAHDESRRLAQENPSWREQKSVTLRFRAALDLQAVPAMRDRIMREAKLGRRTQDSLASGSITESVSISIDPRTLESVDSIGAYDILFKDGVTIVASGYPREALRLMGLLNTTKNQDAHIALVAAYAYLELGQYFHARAYAASAGAGASALSESDRGFLDGITDICEFRLGTLSADDFERRAYLREQNATEPIRSFNRLERLRRSVLGVADPAERSRVARELKETVEEILRNPHSSQPMKLHARIELLHSEGTEQTLETIHQYFRTEMRKQFIGVHQNTTDSPIELQRRQQAWANAADATVAEAVKLRHPLVIAQAMFTRAAICISKLMTTRLIDYYTGCQSPTSSAWISFVESELRVTSDIYHRSGSEEGLLRTKMALADLLELSNRLDDAKSLANEIVPRAAALGFTEVSQRAQNLLDGTTILSEAKRTEAEAKTADPDKDWIGTSDNELRMRARGLLEARGLGPERLPAIERDYFATRYAARERIEWCQHLQLQQDLTHLANSETAYRRDPNRVCLCKKHGWRSVFEMPDYIGVTAEFKGHYCSDCPDRSPKSV
ncbi:MAG: hypothetical protein JWN40_1892 [Phycisphaerales bacterium]|nr:hypothetical protein [Phycisphaerales bacterium]